MTAKMGIGELARRTACTVETVRYYEHTGLMPNPQRTAGGHRVYGLDHLKRLGFIRRARELGFGMDQIQSLLSMMDSGGLSCGEVARKTEQHLKDVRHRIAVLKKMEWTLSATLSQCHQGETADCPIIDALFTPDGGDD
ncbi:MAG: helix-turn-helix domain-containing protein [Magnetovibrio sp.]|nr:helix-turn-helix domain-containing protein [Magnetovibrio sp.]